MSVEIFPVLQGHEAIEFYLQAEWKDLAECIDTLDSVKSELDVMPLGGFCSYTRQEAIQSLCLEDIEEMESEGELRGGVWYRHEESLWSLEEQWFSPENGLQTVRAAIEYSKSHPETFEDEEDASYVITVLQQLEAILVRAQKEGTHFHLKFSG